jgi:hypothetical protein
LRVSAKLFCIIIVISSFSICMVSVAPVEAIIPQVQDVTVWNSGGETILNITVYHTPLTSLHHVDTVEVDVEGNITSFPVDQPSTTFIVQTNLGQITGTPSTRVRAHCTIDGWSPWSETFQVPEFSSLILLSIFIIATVVVVIYGKNRQRKG